MTLQIFFANTDHYEEIIKLHRTRLFYFSSLRDLEQEEVRRFQEKRMRKILNLTMTMKDLAVLVAIDEGSLIAYMILYFGSEGAISNTPHGLIVDLHARDNNSKVLSLMINKAEEYVRALHYRHLVVIWPVGDTGMHSFLDEMNFDRECVDFLVKIKPVNLKPPEYYTIERAKPGDIEDVVAIGVENIGFLLSPFREITIEEGRENFLRYARSLPPEALEQVDHALLVARHSTEPVILGFIFIDFGKKQRKPGNELFERTAIDQGTGIPQGYINYIAVRRTYQGKYVAQHLIEYAAGIFRDRGFHYFAGEIVETNPDPRAVLLKLYRSHFDVEKMQRVKIISS
jgi:ribosomal protein S18 acetylase RimI-like enzyme